MPLEYAHWPELKGSPTLINPFSLTLLIKTYAFYMVPSRRKNIIHPFNGPNFLKSARWLVEQSHVALRLRGWIPPMHLGSHFVSSSSVSVRAALLWPLFPRWDVYLNKIQQNSMELMSEKLYYQTQDLWIPGLFMMLLYCLYSFPHCQELCLPEEGFFTICFNDKNFESKFPFILPFPPHFPD